jgi:hypothetical protein
MPNVNETKPQTPTSDAGGSDERASEGRSSLARLVDLTRRLLGVSKADIAATPHKP